MILLDVQKLSIRKKIGFSKRQTVPGIFNTGLEIPRGIGKKSPGSYTDINVLNLFH